MTLSLNWELDPIFAGGSASPALAEFLDTVTADLAAFQGRAWPPLSAETQPDWVQAIQTLNDLHARLHHAASFIGCLVAQDVKDDLALQLQSRAEELGATLESLWTVFSAAAAQQPDEAWQALVESAPLAPAAFYLTEQRHLARQKMAPEQETLVNQLATSGYHAWDRLYGIVSGDKEVDWDGKAISLGQLQNKLFDDPDRDTRRRAFELYETAWADLARVCAEALNHQAGFRLALYQRRGWDSVLYEPLLNNRLGRDSLEAMWAVVNAKSARLLDYFAAKARLLGIDRLHWYDVYAPVGRLTESFSYRAATDFVVDNLRAFNPPLADFARMALDRRWVEAEDRPGKRAGGFCTGLPLAGESRIFMTFNNSYNGMLTLAHELGHAYHSWVMRDLPYTARHYTMGVAETASTFNELVVGQAGLNAANDDLTRLSLLGSKLDDAATFLMNIKARFDFEVAFFQQRAKKHLGVDELSALMLQAQQAAYKNGLAQYHPLFWASKLHFYITQAPFYNYPYTFGYLFSNGVYAQALAEGQAFSGRYQTLLRDTGSMSTEDLARAHLGVDLTRPEFWETAVDRALADIDEFSALANRLAA
jgi:pepF/M3 family oligoendopeptidase